MRERPRRRVTRTFATTLLAGMLLVAVDVAAASNVTAGLQEAREFDVPTWLYLLTGGAAVGASGLLATLVTDRLFIDVLHDWSHPIPSGDSIVYAAHRIGGMVGVIALATIIVVGFVGPQIPVASAATLLVFVGMRASLLIVAYLVANPWPTLNPWRRIAAALPHGFRDYPDSLGMWPGVTAFLAVVWLEVVAPVNTVPSFLALTVALYSVFTVAGAVVFSPDDWFEHADPLSLVFRFYGAVAPLQRTDDGFEFVLPGARLRDSDIVTGLDEVAFVVAIVWELTYSGFVATPPGARTIERLVAAGLPPAVVYLFVLLAGYGVFLGAYLLAARFSRHYARTYLTPRTIAVRFAPALLAIAAGYHLAHYATFAYSLSSTTVLILSSPLAPPANPVQLVPPDWMHTLDAGYVLVGHLVAIWVAHATSFKLFPGRLQAIKSQYPFVAVMVFYTILSLWLVSLPTVMPPYAG